MLSGRHALVTDFGVAKAVSEATGRQTLTTAGVALGTPAYMAPEQAAADPHTDHRADIYAFGVVAYELLTGRPPFTGASPQAILAAHVTTAADPVTKFRASIPPALAALVMRCLEKKPADRWQSADELIPQLEAVLTPSGGMTPTATRPVLAVRPMARRRWILAGAGAVAALAIGFQMLRRTGPGGEAVSAGPGLSTIAVLPFVSRSPDSSDAYLAEAISEQIGSRLSKVPGVRVISAAAVAAQLRRTPDPVEAARSLKVDWYVTGSLRRSREELAAHTEVVHTATMAQAWSGPFSRHDDDLQALDGEISDSIRVAIVGETGAGTPVWSASTTKRDPEAYRLYLLGNALMTRRTESSVRQAVEAYEQAVTRDPGFAGAWARLSLARSYQVLWITWDAGIPKDSVRLLSLEAANRAVKLDSLSAEAWLARAEGATSLEADFRSAQMSLERALRLDSLNPEIHERYGVMLGGEHLNELEAAKAHLRRALALEPGRPNTWRHLALVELHRGDLGKSEAVLDTTLRFGLWAPAFDDRAYVRYLRRNGHGALEDLAEADQLRGTFDTVSHAAYRLLAGDSLPAREQLLLLARARTSGPLWLPAMSSGESRTQALPPASNRAWLAMALGNRAGALSALEQLPIDSYTWAALHDPAYLPLRSEPRFQVLLKKNKAAIKWDFSK